jgi:hypothetical protein
MEEICMSLHETVKEMRELLAAISIDLEKASGGNKAASQRVRTGTIKLEKSAKRYRKESIKAEKGSVKKGPAKKAKAKTMKVKARPKAKEIQAPMKRQTAKIPTRR